jgi:hypothetical protein
MALPQNGALNYVHYYASLFSYLWYVFGNMIRQHSISGAKPSRAK